MRLTEVRFTMIDMIFSSMACVSLATGHFIQMACIIVLGTLLSVLATVYSKNQQWQKLSKQGDYVAAIRKYRELFKTGLKEAVEAVQAYEIKMGWRDKAGNRTQ